MGPQDQDRFKHAWLDPQNRIRINALAKRFTFREPYEDLRQRAFVHIWTGEAPWPEGTVLHHRLEAVMRHLRTDATRSYEAKNREHGVEAEDVVPDSDRQRTGERLTMMKQRAEAVLARFEKELGEGVTAKRARIVLACLLERITDTDVLLERCECTNAQLAEARRLAKDVLEKVLAKQDKVESR